jgi:hypothetical protein
MSPAENRVDYCINKKYSCILYYTFDGEKDDEGAGAWFDRTYGAFEDAVFKLECAPRFRDDIDVSTTGAGPAWSAYIEVESEDWKKIDSFMKSVCAELKRLGGKIIH